MSIDKTAQFNWLRRLKDRNRNNNEGGQELSFNEQEFRGLQDVARRNADAERQRVDSLVKEYRKIAEKVGRPISIPGAFELSVDNVKKVYSMESNVLWSALCAGYENCSQYVSEDTVYRGRLIRSIVENRNSSAAGWGKTLEGIELLLRGLEVDVQDMARSNRLEEGSYEWAKRIFTNKEWLIENRKTLENAVLDTRPNSEHETGLIFKKIFKNLTEDPSGNGDSRVFVEALIKLWALWFSSRKLDFSNYIENNESAWLQFRNYIKQNQGEHISKIGMALSKKYLPVEMQTRNDGVHDIEINIFNVFRPGTTASGNWDIGKWRSFIRDMHTMMSFLGTELKGQSNLKNINGKNIFFNMTQKIMMIENIVRNDPFISNIFKIGNMNIIPDVLYLEVDKDIRLNPLGTMGAYASAYQQAEVNGYQTNRGRGYPREAGDASDEYLERAASNYMSEGMLNALLHLQEGENFYQIKNNSEQYSSSLKKITELQYKVWENVRDSMNPDLSEMSPEEATQYTKNKIKDVRGRDFGSDNAQKAKEERILDSPFEHASRIVPSSFPGSGAFNPNYLPGIRNAAVPFNIAVYPRKKENDPENFAQVFEPPSESPGSGGFNFHHHSIKTLDDENHYNHIIGWIGGYVDMAGKNMYIVELQSDVMQNTNFMKDPGKSKNKLNEDLKRYNQELTKEKENLAKQSAEGIDSHYDKRIKDLEKKRDAANNDNMKQQMDTAIQKLTEQKNAKEDPWGKLRKKIQDAEKVIAEISNQIKELAEYESNSKDSWRKRPQYADVKSKIENRFSEYIDVFWNEVIYYCAKLKIENLWISHSEHLAKAWSTYITPDTVNLYKKIYDKKAQEFGAEQQGQGYFWHLDLTKKMPKYANTNWYQRTKNAMV